jgi:hypothetical protein
LFIVSRVVVVVSNFFSLSPHGLVHFFRICASASSIIDKVLLLNSSSRREYYRCTIKLRQHCSCCPINCFSSESQAREIFFSFSSGLVSEQIEKCLPSGSLRHRKAEPSTQQDLFKNLSSASTHIKKR